MSYASWQDLVREPASERHIVQVYREIAFLHEAVASWLAPTLRAGGGVVVIGSAANVAGIEARLRWRDVDVGLARAEGRLVVLDASVALSQFMRGATVDAAAFVPLARAAIAKAREAASPDARGEVRAWGEMVDLLRKRGASPAAQRLESLWNEVIDAEDARLLCSYEMDSLSLDGLAHGALDAICAGHSQLIPGDDYAQLDLAVGRALVDVYGEADAGLARANLSKHRSVPIGMPTAQAVLLALSRTQPDEAERVLHATRRYLADANALMARAGT